MRPRIALGLGQAGRRRAVGLLSDQLLERLDRASDEPAGAVVDALSLLVEAKGAAAHGAENRGDLLGAVHRLRWWGHPTAPFTARDSPDATAPATGDQCSSASLAAR